MLCKLLEATNVAGCPGSLFHEPSVDVWLDYYGLANTGFASERATLEAIFAAAIARGKGETGVFGLRLQQRSFAFFLAQLALLYPGHSTDLKRFETAFGPTLFIHLHREDRLGQAISRLRAEQTGLWHKRANGTDLERQAPRREDGYDPKIIQTYLRELESQHEAWNGWFATQSITPFKVTYEALSQNPQGTLSDILHLLGLDGAVARATPTQTKKLADETNAAWRARFLAETHHAE